jgi:hypothetical protein
MLPYQAMDRGAARECIRVRVHAGPEGLELYVRFILDD